MKKALIFEKYGPGRSVDQVELSCPEMILRKVNYYNYVVMWVLQDCIENSDPNFVYSMEINF